MPASITMQAPAKLNLALSVGPVTSTPRGPMHSICSWMVTIDLFDDLQLTRLEHGSLSRYAILWHRDAKRRRNIDWSITKDLTVRAHLALEKHIGRSLPVQLKLEKRVPVGGGLGGGSSDAAAMLRALNDLFELSLSMDELAAIGAAIGSDVPFLVHGGSALVEGVGDQLTLHDSDAQIDAIVAFPEANCSTAHVYQLFDEFSTTTFQPQRVRALAEAAIVKPGDPFNDLAQAAMRAAPGLQHDLDSLAGLAERPAHLTGSGSSIFVLCDNPTHSAALADAAERRLGLPAVAVRSCAIAHASIR